MRCSVQPRNRIFVKGYGFFSFVKTMGKNIGKNISKNLSSKYSQKLLDHAKSCKIQRQLQMTSIKKYLKKGYISRRKNRQLLII